MEIYMHLQNNAKGDLDLFIYFLNLFIHFFKAEFEKRPTVKGFLCDFREITDFGLSIKKKNKKTLWVSL